MCWGFYIEVMGGLIKTSLRQHQRRKPLTVNAAIHHCIVALRPIFMIPGQMAADQISENGQVADNQKNNGTLLS